MKLEKGEFKKRFRALVDGGIPMGVLDMLHKKERKQVWLPDDLFDIVDAGEKGLLEHAISIELKAQPTKLQSGYIAVNEKLIAIPESDWKKWFG